MIYLYLHSFDNTSFNGKDFTKKVPKKIQERIQKKKRPTKQAISLAAYILLQEALQEEMNIGLNEITFLPSGKPIFRDHSIHFNISHCNNLIGVALTKEGAIGLDIEAFREFESVETAFSFFSTVEQKAICTAPNPNIKLIELWSKKEALVKAVGGKMFDMAAHTDVRTATSYWNNKPYYFQAISYDFKGFIWLASSTSSPTIIIKNRTQLR